MLHQPTSRWRPSYHGNHLESTSESFPPSDCQLPSWPLLQLTLASDLHVVMNCGIANRKGNVRINVNLRRVRVTILAVEKQLILFTLSVSYPACAILNFRLWPAWLCCIFPHHFLFGKIFFAHKMCPDFFYSFVWNISYSKKSARYYHKRT